jgi:hypothetical protein
VMLDPADQLDWQIHIELLDVFVGHAASIPASYSRRPR